jgi:hypothetical protein
MQTNGSLGGLPEAKLKSGVVDCAAVKIQVSKFKIKKR